MKKILTFSVLLLSLFVLVSCGKTKFDDHYIVVFYLGGQDRMESVKVEKNGFLTKPKDPESEESSFEGWYYDKEYLIEFDFSKPITESLTIYAKWTYIQHRILYFIEDGVVNSSENPISYTSKLNDFRLRPATREGYRFLSWHLTSDFSDPAVHFLTNDNVTDNMTLYPRWRKLND